MKLKWQGYDNMARKVSGEIEADNPREARSLLHGKGVRATKLVIIEGGVASSANSFTQNSTDDDKVKIDWNDLSTVSAFLSSPVPSLVEFTAFIRQLAVMQASGIPMVQGLGVLADTVETPGFGRALGKIKQKVESGNSFTESLKAYPNIFDRIFINLVAAGEISGSLDQILNRLAFYYEKSTRLRRKVKAAMTYPAFMLVMIFVITTIMLMFVVPIFADMFSSNGKELPAATQFLVDASEALRAYWWLYLGGLGAFVGTIAAVFKNENARERIDPFLVKIPLIGPLIAKIAIARFARTFGTLIQAGVPILEALDITARVAGNRAVERVLLRIKDEVSQGNTISAPLAASKIFPKMATSMIAIGEQTGAIDKMLEKIADFYEEEVDAVISGITSIIEPFMIVIVGAVVAGILIPMYLPVFNMGDVMSGG